MFCQKTKEFLSQNGIAFQERNILADASALDDLKKYGYMTTPVTVVNGEVIVGYEPEKIAAAVRSG
jgi:arsenate reductase-like glutaredoxin family protein